MAKAPKDRSSVPSRTFVPEGGTGVFGGSARTEATVKFDPNNPIHVGVANNRENNPNSHVSYGKKGSITIPLPGRYSEEDLPVQKPKREYDSTNRNPKKAKAKKAASKKEDKTSTSTATSIAAQLPKGIDPSVVKISVPVGHMSEEQQRRRNNGL